MLKNHVHMLITPPSIAAMSAAMKSTLQGYARYRNQQREGSGKLFEQRYYSKPVTDEQQLAATHVYIDANPARAGIVDNPELYPWCTHALSAQRPSRCGIPRRMWTPGPWYRSLGDTDVQRGIAYRELFWDYLRRGVRPAHADQTDELERVSQAPYSRRLRRPDNSSAREPGANWA